MRSGARVGPYLALGRSKVLAEQAAPWALATSPHADEHPSEGRSVALAVEPAPGRPGVPSTGGLLGALRELGADSTPDRLGRMPMKVKMDSSDPDIRGSLPALRRAARAAGKLAVRTGTPFNLIHDGRIVNLNPWRKRSAARKRPHA